MGANQFSPLPISEAMSDREPSLIAPAEPTNEPIASFLPFIVGFSSLLTEGVDLDTLLNQSLAGLVAALPGSACACIYLKQGDSDRLMLVAQYHQCVTDGVVRRSHPELAAQVVEYVKPITVMVRHTHDVPFSPILGLPISVAGRALGALIIEADAGIYGDGDTALFNLLTAGIAFAIENDRLRQRLADALGPQPTAYGEQYAI